MNGFILVIDKVLSVIGLLSKEFFILLAKVVNLKRNLISNGTEIDGVGAVVGKLVERGEFLLEFSVESLPLTDFNGRN